MFDFFYAHKIKFILLLVLISTSAVFYLPALKLDNSFKIWFVENDPVLLSYNAFLEDFGNDEVVITTITAGSLIINEQALEQLNKLEIELSDIAGIDNVACLSQLLRLSHTQSDLEKIKWLIKNTESAKRFCNATLTTFIVYSTFEKSENIDKERFFILAKIDSLARLIFPQEEIRHAGTGVIHNALNKSIEEQAALYLPIAYLLVLLVAYYYTRSWYWITAILLSVVGVNLVVFGTMAASGQPLTMITSAIPLLILIITVANTMHYARAVSERDLTDLQKRKLAFMAISKPSFFNALTTAGGFISLMVAFMPITRNYGMFAAFGVLLSFAFSSFFSLLFINRAGQKRNNFKSAFITKIWLYTQSKPVTVIITSILIMIICIPGFFNLNTDTFTIKFLSKKNRVRIDSEAIEKNSGNYLPLDFIIENSETNFWENPLFFEQLMRAKASILKNTRADAVYSIADMVFDLHKINSYPDNTPAQPAHIRAGIITIKYSGLLKYFIKDNKVRLTCFVPMASAGELARTGERILSEIKTAINGGSKISRAGYLPLYNRLIDYLVEDQLQSLTIAFFVIAILMFAFLRSFKMLIIVLIVNGIPIYAVFSIMGYSHINLDVATITVAPAMIGIIVDDTLHLLFHIKKQIPNGTDIRLIIKNTLQNNGAALLATSIVFIIGFSVLFFAPLNSISNTGILIVITTLLAIITDIVLLPVLVLLMYGKPAKQASVS